MVSSFKRSATSDKVTFEIYELRYEDFLNHTWFCLFVCFLFLFSFVGAFVCLVFF